MIWKVSACPLHCVGFAQNDRNGNNLGQTFFPHVFQRKLISTTVAHNHVGWQERQNNYI